jgi:hypothetical protein
MSSKTTTCKRPQVAPGAQAFWDKLKEKELKNDRKTIKDTILQVTPDAEFFIRYCKKCKTTQERFTLTFHKNKTPEAVTALKKAELSIPLDIY